MMNTGKNNSSRIAAIDQLIDKIVVDAFSEGEQFWAFRQAFKDDISLPADGFVIGEPVSVIEIDYDGNERRGLTAQCRRENGSVHVTAIGLVPLRLEEFGMWDPKEHYWGEENEPIEDWAKPIIYRGPRLEFEMEQVLPIADDADPFMDPIYTANDLKDADDRAKAKEILMQLCRSDLRCLDAHAHLGNLIFDSMPEKAICHYEVGLRIGELSLGVDGLGRIDSDCIETRPFLRCMQGYGLCLWRQDRFTEAERLFNRLLWLNPSDNQGIRFLIDDVRAGTAVP